MMNLRKMNKREDCTVTHGRRKERPKLELMLASEANMNPSHVSAYILHTTFDMVITLNKCFNTLQ